MAYWVTGFEKGYLRTQWDGNKDKEWDNVLLRDLLVVTLFYGLLH